jgi:hypothetical protein
MAATTLSAILTRIRAVCEASPLFLTPASEPFSPDREPTLTVDQAYVVLDEGLESHRSLTNQAAARIDRVTILVARRLGADPATTLGELEDTLLTLERALKADGPAGSYHAEILSRRVSRPAGKEIALGSLTVTVDYDLSEAL